MMASSSSSSSVCGIIGMSRAAKKKRAKKSNKRKEIQNTEETEISANSNKQGVVDNDSHGSAANDATRSTTTTTNNKKKKNCKKGNSIEYNTAKNRCTTTQIAKKKTIVSSLLDVSMTNNSDKDNNDNWNGENEKTKRQLLVGTTTKLKSDIHNKLQSSHHDDTDTDEIILVQQQSAEEGGGGGGILEDDLEAELDMLALLSTTLTPLQILLLDSDTDTDNGGVGGGDDHGRTTESTMKEATDTAAVATTTAAAVLVAAPPHGKKEQLLNPLQLMSKITTQYRARVLLASLLAPSGVSLNEFYGKYWGKQPLLAAAAATATATAYDDDDDDDEEVHEDSIEYYRKGQTEKGEKKLLNKKQTKTREGGGGGGGGGGRTISQQIQQQQEEYQYQYILHYNQHTTRLDGFLTRTLINDMMNKNKLRYGLDLNVTRYTDTMMGKNGQCGRQRITLDPPPKKRQKKKSSYSTTTTTSSSSSNDNFVNDNVDLDSDVEYIIANPTDVWTNVDTASCTLRLLRPHEHNDNIHTLLSLLEVEFGCMVGSNAYLTPLHSQGFAPHYDDVDVFICQLEGYKRWKVYSPQSKRETLPRLSSRDYTEKEMNNEDNHNMELVLNVILGPGDVLYMPRGWIHQAETVSRPSTTVSSSSKALLSDKHSLHLTISAMQNWCWADFLEVLMPVALESAALSDKSTSLREGLPLNFLHYMGTMHQIEEEDTTLLPEGLRQAAKAQQDRAMAAKTHHDEDDIDDEKKVEEARLIIAHEQQQRQVVQQQRQFKEEAKKRIMRVCKQAMSMLDDACDDFGKRFLSDRLPPALLKTEACLTKEGINGDSSSLHHHRQEQYHHDNRSKKIWPNTLCRLVRSDIARLVVEEGKAVLYHCLDNSRVYHGTPLSPMEFEIDDAPALEQLLTTVEPHWIMVKDLIHGDVEDKMGIAQTLFDEGILATMLVEVPDRSVKTD